MKVREKNKNNLTGQTLETGTPIYIEGLVRQTLFARAVELARLGRYTDAEKLLKDMETKGDNPMVLDLNARIFAQQGRFMEAAALWTRASQLDPLNNDYKTGLERIAKIQRTTLRTSSLSALLKGVIILASIILLLFLLEKYENNRFAALRWEIAAIKEKPGKVTLTASQPTLPGLKIDIPGISSRTADNGIAIQFNSGLFSKNLVLKPGPKKILKTLGRQLQAFTGQVKLYITGCSDDTPIPPGRQFRDNIALGLARAAAVAEYLRENTQLPANMFFISSAGGSAAPYPNNTQENRLKNRTVIMRISHTEK
jgi:type VI secretion system protein ImpK